MLFPDLKLYYKAIVIKPAQYWHKIQIHCSMKQNRESRKKNPHIYGQFIHKSGKNTQWGNGYFLINDFWKTGYMNAK